MGVRSFAWVFCKRSTTCSIVRFDICRTAECDSQRMVFADQLRQILLPPRGTSLADDMPSTRHGDVIRQSIER